MRSTNRKVRYPKMSAAAKRRWADPTYRRRMQSSMVDNPKIAANMRHVWKVYREWKRMQAKLGAA